MKKKMAFLISIIILVTIFSNTSFAATPNKVKSSDMKSYNKNKQKLNKVIKEIDKKIEKDYKNSILRNDLKTSGDSIQTLYVEPSESGGSSPTTNPSENRTFTYLGLQDFGTHKFGSSRVNASASISTNTISLNSQSDPVWSTGTAWGLLGRDFFFNSPSAKSAFIRFQGSFKGDLFTFLNPKYISDGKAIFIIKAEIYDTTTGSRVASRTIESLTYDGFADGKAIFGLYDETINITLRANHSYAAIIYAECKTEARATGSTRSVFHDKSGGYVKLDSVSITF